MGIIEFSIIIVNYNTCVLLKDCIESIYKNTKTKNFEIIVVDNNSKDGSLILLESYNINKKIKLISNSTNKGFGIACNQGSKIAIGKYLFFLNSDTVFKNDVLLKYKEFIIDNNLKNNFVIGSLLFDAENSPIHTFGLLPSPFRILKIVLMSYLKLSIQNLKNEYDFNFSNLSFINVEFITGANIIINKELFDSIYGFDENIFLYYEDTDLFKRLNSSQNIFIAVIKGPIIQHIEKGSNKYSNQSVERKIIVEKSMFYYFKKHNNYFTYLLFRFLFLIVRLPVLFDYRIRILEKKKYMHSLISYN